MKSKKLLTIDEAASRLGLKPCTIRKKILFRQIDTVRIGGAVRVPEEAIDALISRGFSAAVAVPSAR